jgi:hypothetical protein
MLDPINDDVAELRALADETDEATRIEAYGFRWVTSPPTAPERASDELLLSPEQRRWLLLLHDVPFDPTDPTPVLSTLPQTIRHLCSAGLSIWSPLPDRWSPHGARCVPRRRLADGHCQGDPARVSGLDCSSRGGWPCGDGPE